MSCWFHCGPGSRTLAAAGFGGPVEPGHAAVRFTDPATGADVLSTIRAETHRVARGVETAPVD